jgi:hypothetical protein
MDINVTRTNNGVLLETLYRGTYYHKLYSGYTKREARKLFSEFVLKEESKFFYNERKDNNVN